MIRWIYISTEIDEEAAQLIDLHAVDTNYLITAGGSCLYIMYFGIHSEYLKGYISGMQLVYASVYADTTVIKAVIFFFGKKFWSSSEFLMIDNIIFL